MQVKIKKLHPDAQLPRYATPGAAAFDIVAVGDPAPHPTDARAMHYSTGLAFEIPPGHVMLVFSRSGQGFKEAVRASNAVGVIDSDYRGELRVSLRSDADNAVLPKAGERIAQAAIVPVPSVELVEVDELSETERGAGGFGSTGK